MNYNQFVQEVEKTVKKEVRDNVSVYIHTNVKNNGIKRCGITMVEQGINISPTIYLEEYYQQFEQGSSIEMIVGEILRLYGEVRFERSWEGDNLEDYPHVRGKIIYRLVNQEANAELLREVPYMEYLDLAVVFYVLLEINHYGMASMMIRNEHLRMWNTTKEEIYRYARRNTEILLPDEFQTMRAVIEELTGRKETGGKDIMYILSNENRSFGAAAILYEGRLKKIGERLGENFYVLPSSVHEMIIIAESEAPSKEELSEMVAEINRTQVEAEEVLSDHAYYYDRKQEKLVL